MSGEQMEEDLEEDGYDVDGLSGSYYMVYAFEKGTLVINGDGGFHNFICSGKYSHSGNRYTFYPM